MFDVYFHVILCLVSSICLFQLNLTLHRISMIMELEAATETWRYSASLKTHPLVSIHFYNNMLSDNQAGITDSMIKEHQTLYVLTKEHI